MGMMAFAIDTGYVANSRIELKRAVDAGALAGAGALELGRREAKAQAYEFIASNPVAGRPLEHSEIDVQLGEWDDVSRSFRETGSQPSAIRVVATRKEAPFFFGKTLGYENFDVTEEAGPLCGAAHNGSAC